MATTRKKPRATKAKVDKIMTDAQTVADVVVADHEKAVRSSRARDFLIFLAAAALPWLVFYILERTGQINLAPNF